MRVPPWFVESKRGSRPTGGLLLPEEEVHNRAAAEVRPRPTAIQAALPPTPSRGEFCRTDPTQTPTVPAISAGRGEGGRSRIHGHVEGGRWRGWVPGPDGLP